MGAWDSLNCANHPDRIAIERCEVCGKPLCAYCLYYTDDGQRLCAEHAEAARKMGVRVEEPSSYADQLIGAQVGAQRKHKRGEVVNEDGLYKGNSTDLMSLIGLLIGVIAMGACCGAIYCLPVIGLVLSVLAVFGAKKAYDPGRTRRMGLVGMLLSGVWVLLIAGCILAYGFSMTSLIRSAQGPLLSTLIAPTSPPATATSPAFSLPEVMTPQLTPTDDPFSANARLLPTAVSPGGEGDAPTGGDAPDLAVHWEP